MSPGVVDQRAHQTTRKWRRVIARHPTTRPSPTQSWRPPAPRATAPAATAAHTHARALATQITSMTSTILQMRMQMKKKMMPQKMTIGCTSQISRQIHNRMCEQTQTCTYTRTVGCVNLVVVPAGSIERRRSAVRRSVAVAAAAVAATMTSGTCRGSVWVWGGHVRGSRGSVGRPSPRTRTCRQSPYSRVGSTVLTLHSNILSWYKMGYVG